MQRRGEGTSLRLLPITRLAFLLGVVLATIAGIQLYVLSTRTADFFAWTISVPLTAAFLGAFFWANTPSFILAVRTGAWPRVRILVVGYVVLNVFMLITTLRHLQIFHLDEGGILARLAAWAWLLVYVALPWVVIASFVLQERAGGARAYSVQTLAALRFRSALVDDRRTWGYVATLIVLFALTALAAWRQEGQLHKGMPAAV